jgi:hypothetical protein
LFDELDIVVTSIEVLVDDVVVDSHRSWLGVEEGHRFQQKLGSRGGGGMDDDGVVLPPATTPK